MTKGFRCSGKSVFICAAIAIAAVGAAMLVDFSPVSRWQNFPATQKARSGLSGPMSRPAGLAASPARRLVANYGKLPLSFEANEGQTDGRVEFLSRGKGYSLFLTEDEAVLTLESARQKSKGKSPRARVKAGAMPTFGSTSADVAQHLFFGAAPLPDFLSLLGPNEESIGQVEKPRDRRAGPALPPSRRADGGDSSTVLRMSLVGANPNAAVNGAEALPGKSNYFIGNDPKKWRANVPTYAKVRYQNVYPGVDLVYYGNQGGQLEYDFVVAPGADPNQIKLRFTGADNTRVDPASGDLMLKLGEGEVRFHKPVAYQPPIAPVSSALSPSIAAAFGLDAHHSSLVTLDSSFVLATNNEVAFRVAGYDPKRALVIDPSLIYSTYLGGSGNDIGYAIATDSFGNAYVTGQTSSSNFPTMNPYQATPSTTFVAKLNPAGSALVYSTYLGGNRVTTARGIAVDSSGNAFVTGTTGSTNFPTVNPFQATCAKCSSGGSDVFVTEFNATGSALVYSTYLGGSTGDEEGYAIAVDSSGDTYVTGQTASTDFPTANPYQGTKPGSQNAFVTEFNFNASSTPPLTLVYSTYLGGSYEDIGYGIAVDSSGNAYVTGATNSSNFPTANPVQPTCASCPSYYDAFVAKLNFNASSTPPLTLAYSTFLGGSNQDFGWGIAADSAGNAFVTGETISRDFPTVNPLQPTNNALSYEPTVFVARLNTAGSALVYSTYLGGSVGEIGFGIAVDSSDNAYVTGQTSSTNFPTVDAIQANCGGYPSYPEGCYDAFVAELDAPGSALVYSTYLGGSNFDEPYGIAVDSSGNAYVTGTTESTDFPTANPIQPTNGGLSDAFVAKISPGVTVPSASLSPPSVTFAPEVVGSTSAPQTVTLSNTGTGALTISSIVPGANFGETDNCVGSVAAGSSCTISVTFSPTATGPLIGSLTITDNNNGVAGSTQTVMLSGTGLSPAEASVSPTSLTFGNVVINTTSAIKKVTLTSTGSTNLIISGIANSGTNSGDFSQTNTCTAASYAPGAKCTISLTFTPSMTPPGAETATLTVTDNAATNQTVALTGTGEEPVTLSPTSLGFGNVGENSPSAPKTITVTNNQAVMLTISSITLSNSDYSETDNCVGTVAAKGKCTIMVTLTPTVLTADNGTLTVNDNASNSPQATMTGTGVVPAKLSAASLGFGNVPQSTASTAKNITLTNSEAETLNITSIATGNPDFTETDTCDGGVAAKGNCVITVTFTPSMIAAETGTLTVTDAASNSPQTASLTGTGIAQATVTPASLTFASQKVGTTSAAKTVTLTNNLSTALTVGAVTFTGAEAGDFASPTNTCNGSLAAKSKCTISVTFTPTATGTRTATLNVNDSANNSPQTVALTGTGK